MAVATVLFDAFFAVRPVVVAARLAVVEVARADFFAVVIVPLAPADAALAVEVTPDFTLRAVSSTPSVAAEATRRTLFASFRVTDEPVGDTIGFLLSRIRAMRSWTAVTPPCAMPLTLSPTRSTTPAIAPTTRVAGRRVGRPRVGMGRSGLLRVDHRVAEVGERGAAELVAHLREEVALFLLDVVAHVLDEHGDLGVEALVRGSSSSSSDSTHLTMWCSSRLSRAMSSVSGTVARATG